MQNNNSHLKRWGRQQQNLSQWIRACESIIQVGLCFGSFIVLQNHFYLNIKSIAPKVLWAICWSPKMLVSLMRNVPIKFQQWLLWECRNFKCLRVKAPRSEDLGTAQHGMSNTHSHECFRATQPPEAGISTMRKLVITTSSLWKHSGSCGKFAMTLGVYLVWSRDNRQKTKNVSKFTISSGFWSEVMTHYKVHLCLELEKKRLNKSYSLVPAATS